MPPKREPYNGSCMLYKIERRREKPTGGLIYPVLRFPSCGSSRANLTAVSLRWEVRVRSTYKKYCTGTKLWRK